MRVLVTGHRGRIGTWLVERLRATGHEVRGFDRADGQDVCDLESVTRAAAGCTAIVHLGALAHDTAGRPEEIMAVNVLGTWHVLLAAQAAGVGRVVHFSSAQVFGTAEGERLPDFFPIDHAHPRRAARPYGLSKRLAEDLCRAFTERTAIATICLRPVAVWTPADYAVIDSRRADDPTTEWLPFWEFGAFVDVRDVVAAVESALTAEWSGHHRATLCAADISGSAPSLALAARLAPGVPIRDRARYEADPSRALFDCATAERVLGWQPRHRWARRETPR